MSQISQDSIPAEPKQFENLEMSNMKYDVDKMEVDEDSIQKEIWGIDMQAWDNFLDEEEDHLYQYERFDSQKDASRCCSNKSDSSGFTTNKSI